MGLKVAVGMYSQTFDNSVSTSATMGRPAGQSGWGQEGRSLWILGRR